MTVNDFLNDATAPVVGMDQDGSVFFLNDAFEAAYGWTKEDLLGKSMTAIIPANMRDVHQIGFSRFLQTGTPTLMGKPLHLPILRKDGRILSAVHLIIADKIDDRWRFVAKITLERPA